MTRIQFDLIYDIFCVAGNLKSSHSTGKKFNGHASEHIAEAPPPYHLTSLSGVVPNCTGHTKFGTLHQICEL